MRMTLRRRHSVGGWTFDGGGYGTRLWRRTWFAVEVVSSRLEIGATAVFGACDDVALIVVGHTYNTACNSSHAIYLMLQHRSIDIYTENS